MSTGESLHEVGLIVVLRSNDGLTLIMSSSDGYCSHLAFAPGELGQVYTGHVPTAHHPSLVISTVSSAQVTPTPTPVTATAPPLEKQLPPGFVSTNSPALTPVRSTTPSTQPSFRPPSPTRSNSTSSVATQSGIVTSNPTPTLGNVPSVAATNSSFSGLPMTTPPLTPMGGVVSRSSSVSGSVLGKRDTSESELEEANVPKKKRIAPTLVPSDRTPGA